MVKEADLKGPIFRQLGRRITIPLVWFIHKHTKLTPNQITLAVGLLSILNGYFFFEGLYPYFFPPEYSYWFLVAGGILIILRYIFDFVDGSLARVKNTASMTGYWFDHHADEFGKLAVFLGIILGVYYATTDSLVLIMGLLIMAFYFYGSLTYQIFMRLPAANDMAENEKSKWYLKLFIQFFPTDPQLTAVIALAAFINKMYWLVVILTVWTVLFAIAQWFMMSYRLLKKPKVQE